MSDKHVFCIKYKSGDQGYSDLPRVGCFDFRFYAQTTSKREAIAEFKAAIERGGIAKGSRCLEVIDGGLVMGTNDPRG